MTFSPYSFFVCLFVLVDWISGVEIIIRNFFQVHFCNFCVLKSCFTAFSSFFLFESIF